MLVRGLHHDLSHRRLRPQPFPAMTQSIWQATASIPSRPPLEDHVTADVCVVGAGIAGLSVAYQLARAGKRVVVLEKEQIGSGETGRTTAHLSKEIDDRYTALE